MKYIYHHLGLGDHIICNGLVRSIIQENELYTMFVKPHNLQTVKFMYRDIDNLSFYEANDNQANEFLIQNKIKKENIIIAGFWNHPNSKEFDESFYLQNNLPFNLRWEAFKCLRDLESEKKIFDYYNLKEKEYVFIHDDNERNYVIENNNVINDDLPIIRPIKGLTSNAFDYCYLMENSKELHFIDSTFKLIYDSLFYNNKMIFFHIKLKNGIVKDINTKSHSKNKFIIIK